MEKNFFAVLISTLGRFDQANEKKSDDEEEDNDDDDDDREASVA